MKTLMANEVAFVSGGEDTGTCPAAGPAGGCYSAPPSGCTTTTPNGPTITYTIGVTQSGLGGGVSVAFPSSTTTCPTPAPGTGGGGNSGSGGSMGDWLRDTGPMVSASAAPWITVI
jgi:hypothetical protein